MSVIKDVKRGFFRKIGYLLATLLFGYLCAKFGIIAHVSASTIDTTNKNYRIRTCYNKNSGDCSWVSGNHDMGTQYSLSRGTGTNDKGILDAVMARLTYSGNFQGGMTYRLSINLQASAKLNKRALREVICGGVADTLNWSSNEDLISKCEISGIVSYDSGNKTSYYVDFTPLTNFKGIQVQIYFYQPIDTITYINMLSSTNIQVDTSTQDAINNQTTIINQNFDETNTNINNVNDSINDVKDTLIDSTPPNIDNLQNADGWLPAGPLDSVVNLPISIMNSLNNHMVGSCQPFVITLPFVNRQLSIPCISDLFSRISGLQIFLDFIGAIAGGLILYNYLIYLYNWVDDVTSLKHGRPRFFGANSDVENWGGD